MCRPAYVLLRALQTFGESPAAEFTPPEAVDRIFHASLQVGDTVLMGSDAPPGERAEHEGFFVSLQIDALAEAQRVFHALPDGGSVTMPIEQTFWATRFGISVDRFGIPWIVNCAEAAQ
jgi:PhnB protein